MKIIILMILFGNMFLNKELFNYINKGGIDYDTDYFSKYGSICKIHAN